MLTNRLEVNQTIKHPKACWMGFKWPGSFSKHTLAECWGNTVRLIAKLQIWWDSRQLAEKGGIGSAFVLVQVLFRAAVCDLRFCLGVSVWHLQGNAWYVVALMCLCMFGSLVLCICLSPSVVLSLLSFFDLFCRLHAPCSTLCPPPSYILADDHPHPPIPGSMNMCTSLFFIVSLYLYVCCYLNTSCVFTRPVLVCVSCRYSNTLANLGSMEKL